MARGFALQPELAARTAVERDEAGFDGLAEGLFIHIADHQHAARGMVLNDGSDQPIRFSKVQIHRKDNKKPASTAAGVLSNFEWNRVRKSPGTNARYGDDEDAAPRTMVS